MSPSRPPRRVLTLLALTLATLLVAAAAQSAQTNATAVNATDGSTVSLPFCALCRDRGQCDQAYRGGAGVFCASHPSHRVCCCASADACPRAHSSSGECECLLTSNDQETPRTSPRPTPQARIGIFSSHKIVWTLLAMGVLGALFAMYMYTTRLDRKYHYREPACPRTAYRPPRVLVADAVESSPDSKSSRSRT